MNDQEAKLFLQQIRNVSKNETQSNTKTCIKTTPAYVISVNGQMATVRLVTDLTGANPFNVPIITSQTISPGDYANLAYWDNLSTAVIFSGGNNYPICPNIPIRPNLIDNGCFVGGGTGWGAFPVNQRGQTSYGVGHAFDRWKINGGTCTLKPSGVSWTAGFVLYQMMDGLNLADGKARTVSYVDENHRGFSGVLTASYTAIGNYSFTYDTGTSLYMLGHTDAPAIAWVKLEEGENQTLYAENGDGTVTVLPQGLDYGQELAKCQAYLKPLAGFYTGGTPASSVTKVSFFVPGPMRALPVVSGVANLSDAYIAGAEIPDGIVYFGNASFNVIQRGNGYIVQVEQPKSIGSLKNGRVAFDVGWLNAEL